VADKAGDTPLSTVIRVLAAIIASDVSLELLRYARLL
jgi:hypothetical protein